MPSWFRKVFSKPVQPEQDPRIFVNREIEIAELRSILYGPPAFTVMLGPPSTGKTRLMNHLLRSMKVDGTPEFHALNVNLRGVDIHRGELFWELVDSSSKVASAADKAWRLFSEIASNIKTLKISAIGALSFRESKIPNKGRHMLDALVKSVPVWKAGSNVPFVLVIDEANALRSLAANDNWVNRRFERSLHRLTLCLFCLRLFESLYSLLSRLLKKKGGFMLFSLLLIPFFRDGSRIKART